MSGKVHFIITGGTIDAFYSPTAESGRPLKESIIPDYIRDAIRPYRKVSFETICMKDSGDLTEGDRRRMLKAILSTKTPHIVISHGTSAMQKTAEILKKKLPAGHGKTVVLTGAMTPLKQFAMSDGGFNLGFAVSAAINEAPGVYICMHGEVFVAGSVTKNNDDARFEFIE